MLLKVTISLFLMSLLCGCSPLSSSPLVPQSVVGTFKGSYGGADEIFIFRLDGTFTQTLSIANKPQYTNDGQWEIKGNQIQFRNIYTALDLKGKLQPEKMYNMDGLWVTWDQGRRIVFNIDHDYVLDKVEPLGTTEPK